MRVTLSLSMVLGFAVFACTPPQEPAPESSASTASTAEPLVDAADVETTLTINGDGTCSVGEEFIKCDGKPCKMGKKIWWVVTNNHTDDADIALVDFMITIGARDYYVDPLRSPNDNGGMHREQVSAGDTETIKTRVRKLDPPFGSDVEEKARYSYKVAVSFDPYAAWTVCLDPMIDIGT